MRCFQAKELNIHVWVCLNINFETLDMLCTLYLELPFKIYCVTFDTL